MLPDELFPHRLFLVPTPPKAAKFPDSPISTSPGGLRPGFTTVASGMQKECDGFARARKEGLLAKAKWVDHLGTLARYK